MYVHELLLFGSREGENVSERIRDKKRERESKGQMLRSKE